MLIKIGGKERQSSLLPKLKTSKSEPRTRIKRSVADDSADVEVRMEQLFGKYNWRTVTSEEDVVKFLVASEELGFDTETTGLDIFKSELVGLSFGTDTECIYIPLRHVKELSRDLKSYSRF